MKKSLSKALLITVSVSTLVHASENIVSTKDVNNFKLDEEKITNYQIKEATDSSTTSQSDPQEKVEINQEYPKIIEEKTATGRIEKLVDENGHILAQKTIENDKVIQKVLNYYHPNGKLSRQITADENEYLEPTNPLNKYKYFNAFPTNLVINKDTPKPKNKIKIIISVYQ